MDNIVVSSTDKDRSAIVLITNITPCVYTLKKVLETKCKIVGIVFCEKKGFSYRFKKEIRDIKKYGLFKRLSQISLSIYFKLFKSNSEKNYLKICYENFNTNEIFEILKKRNIEYIFTSDYQSSESLNFIQDRKADFFISHTPYWIGKKFRDLFKDKIIIGSHPGLVPLYRGAHSAFWTMYCQDEDNNGFSIFRLNEGVDSGPIIKQERISYDKKISYLSNDYLIMKKCSIAHSQIAEDYSLGKSLVLKKQENLDPSQIKKSPDIFDYIRSNLK